MIRFGGWRRAALTLFVVVAAACSDTSPTQPDAQYEYTTDGLLTLGTVTEAMVDVSEVATYRNAPSSSSAVSLWIGPAGGTLRLRDFEIRVPAGAVLVPTKFTIKLPSEKNLNRAMAEFKPHGVRFLQPVTLRTPYSGTTADGTTPSVIGWWNGFDWVPYETTLLPDGRAETQTDHFSFFGILLPGITPVGG